MIMKMMMNMITHCVVPVGYIMLMMSSGYAVTCASDGFMANVSRLLQRELSTLSNTSALHAAAARGPELEGKEGRNLNLLEIGIWKGGEKPFWTQCQPIHCDAFK